MQHQNFFCLIKLLIVCNITFVKFGAATSFPGMFSLLGRHLLVFCLSQKLVVPPSTTHSLSKFSKAHSYLLFVMPYFNTAIAYFDLHNRLSIASRCNALLYFIKGKLSVCINDTNQLKGKIIENKMNYPTEFHTDLKLKSYRLFFGQICWQTSSSTASNIATSVSTVIQKFARNPLHYRTSSKER